MSTSTVTQLLSSEVGNPNICNNSNSSSLLLDFRIELVFVFHWAGYPHTSCGLLGTGCACCCLHMYTQSIIVNRESDLLLKSQTLGERG